MKLTREQIKEGLDQLPIKAVLNKGRAKELTPKQKRFVTEHVIKGETKSNAYRKAYNTKAKPDNVKVSAHRVKSKPHVSLTIQAIQQANEAMKYQNAESLRSLAITSLVNVLTDPDAKPQAKIQASKIIGQMTEVSLFTHRSETKVIHSSEDIKAKILQEIKGLMSGDIEDVIEKDATSLLAELTIGSENSESQDPTDTPDPTLDSDAPYAELHTIPHEQSNQLSDYDQPHDLSAVGLQIPGEGDTPR